jgi:large subunit ribosomal protein L14
MIMLGSTMEPADNAGAKLFKCITIYGGFNRRYAGLGEMVGSVSKTRRVYRTTGRSDPRRNKTMAKKVRKKRKQKSKKIKIYVRPYLTLLVSLKKSTNRLDGSYVKFDKNRVITFSEPTKFGPAGKSTGVPNFLGTRVFGPICRELRLTKKLYDKYRLIIRKSRGVV